MLNVVEVFNSIEGEGIRQGAPVTFVRFAGCNLHCKWCDTKYACSTEEDKVEYGENGGKFTSSELNKIIEEMALITAGKITFTGGEPLSNKEQVDFIYDFALAHQNYDINIETNGSIDPNKLLDRSTSNITITMDYKCKSADSGCKQNYLHKLRDKDCLKVVVGSEEDIKEMKNVLRKMRLLGKKCTVFVHQVYGTISLEKIADEVMNCSDIYRNVNIGYQLHKLIWDPEKRGV